MSAESPSAPWYCAGIRFCCQSTGRCCSNHGEFTHVYLGPAEIERLARHLALAVATFKRRYTECVDGFRALRSRGADCVFLENGRCSVYAARPEQCATWPFWKENLTDAATWEREVALFCAGVGRGRLFPMREIEAMAERAERALDAAED